MLYICLAVEWFTDKIIIESTFGKHCDILKNVIKYTYIIYLIMVMAHIRNSTVQVN